MPFAASTKIHRPLDIEKKHDVVVVGGYRGDRVEEIKKLISHFNVGVYGGGWEKGGIKSYGNVNGERHVEAINSGLIYISFSKTVAGYNNVKVGLFEAAACKKCIITTDFPEVYEYFKKDEEIITYNNTEELIRKISYLLNNKDEIELISKKSYERFLMEHTWRSRWKTVISKIE
jgi:spore maturation protein CgeB